MEDQLLRSKSLEFVHVKCCICETDGAEAIGVGKDFEYNTSPDIFSAMKCRSCGLVYLNPRPHISEFEKIYPSNYHAFGFSKKEFGIVYKVRSWLEAKRLLSCCAELPSDARVLDIGCGDGFHLKLLRRYGKKSWTLEGIDMDKRAIEMSTRAGFTVHWGTVESADLPQDTYDLAFMIQTIEHVAKPDEVLRGIYRLLKPGGRLLIVTDNTDSLDFSLFKKSYWGGYHFPRHWNLFNKHSFTKLAHKTGLEVVHIGTQVSPVNWVYTIHNWLVARQTPRCIINLFTLRSAVSLAVFTILDIVLQKFRKGALLRAILRKPMLVLTAELLV